LWVHPRGQNTKTGLLHGHRVAHHNLGSVTPQSRRAAPTHRAHALVSQICAEMMTDSPTQQASPDTQVATTRLKTKDMHCSLAFRGGARACVSNTGGHAATDTRASPSTVQQPSDALNDFDCVPIDDVGAGAAVPRSASAPATTGRDGVGGDGNEVEQVQEEATMAPERAPSGRAAAVERTKRRSIHRAAVRVSVCVCVCVCACVCARACV
jgi:hypothetical protein